MSIVINNGWFDAVIGRAARSDKFVFIPVMGDIDDERFDLRYIGKEPTSSTFDLSDYIEDPTPIIKSCGNLQYPDTIYAIWVRGRITSIFGYGIPLPDLNGLIDQTFIACRLESEGSWTAYTFRCEDNITSIEPFILTAVLQFPENNRLTRIYKEIIEDFCLLLLKDANNIHPFSAKYDYFDTLEGCTHNIEFSQEYKFYVEEDCTEQL
jgi:hypothetical protein